MLPDPELEKLLDQTVEVTITVRGILTGYFEAAIVLDVENGPDNFMVMTKVAGFNVDIKGVDQDAEQH